MARTLKSLGITAIFLVIIAMIVTQGCKGPQIGGELTKEQKMALARMAGNGLGLVLLEVKPQYAIPAGTFCTAFFTAQNLAEQQRLFDTALVWLANRHTDEPRLGIVAANLLKVVGFNESSVDGYINGEISRLEPITQDILDYLLAGLTGVCEVL